MAGTQNLIPAKPGDVRNPRGKPKGTLNISTRIREIFSLPIEWDKITITDTTRLKERYGNVAVADALIHVQISKALTGDTQAFNALRDAGWGKMINMDGSLTMDVMHIYKPEKLEAAQMEAMAEQLRERANKAVEAEVLDEVDRPAGTADLRSINS